MEIKIHYMIRQEDSLLNEKTVEFDDFGEALDALEDIKVNKELIGIPVIEVS